MLQQICNSAVVCKDAAWRETTISEQNSQCLAQISSQ